MKMHKTLTSLAIAGALAAAPAALLAQDGSSSGSDSPNGESSASTASSDRCDCDSASNASGSSASPSDGSGDAMARSTNDGTAPARAFMKTVNEAHEALREVRAARMAIFNGHPEAAKKLVVDARTNLEQAQSLIERFQVPMNAGGQPESSSSADGSGAGSGSDAGTVAGSGSGGGQKYLPVDISMIIAEGYLIPADERRAVQRANAQLMRGDRVGAARTLRDASIEVIVNATMIPARKSLEHARKAEELMGEDKPYEANVALKAIEDSIVTRSFGLDADPRQGGRSASGPDGDSSGSGGQGGQGGRSGQSDKG